MLAWGIMLIGMGFLSFVLPIFGRQFIVVSLLGVTGMGASVTGVAMMVLGALLLSISQKSGALAPSQPSPLPPQEDSSATLSELKRTSLFPESEGTGVITEKAFTAADGGNVAVQVLIGMAYLAGSDGLPQNPEKAFHYLHMAALRGHATSSFIIAGMFADGLGVGKNLDHARMWAMKAKERGATDADQMLAAIDSKRGQA